MKYSYALLLLLNLPTVLPAARAEGTACEMAGQIWQRAESCEDNVLFSQAADSCFATFERESNSAALAASAHREGGQDRSLSAARDEYQQASRTLAGFLARGTAIAADLTAYENKLLLPEDSEEEDVNGGASPHAYAWNVSCYGNAARHLRETRERLDSHMNRLAAAEEESSRMVRSIASGAGMGSELQVLSPAPSLVTGAAATQFLPSVPEFRASDVSGVPDQASFSEER